MFNIKNRLYQSKQVYYPANQVYLENDFIKNAQKTSDNDK